MLPLALLFALGDPTPRPIDPATVAAWEHAGAIPVHFVRSPRGFSYLHLERDKKAAGTGLPGFLIPGRLRAERLKALPPVGTRFGLSFVTSDTEKVTDADLDHLAGLEKLVHLDLSRTRVTSAGVPALARLARLEGLYLSGTLIDDGGAKGLKALGRLTDLDLGGTRVGGEGLEALAGLSELAHLDLNNTPVNDAGLGPLLRLKKLRSLSLYNNHALTAAGLETVGRLDGLRALNLGNCSRLGPAGLPALAGLKRLEWLDYGGLLTDGVLLGLHAQGRLHVVDAARGDGPGQPARSEDVTAFDASSRRVTDAGLKALAGFVNLRKVNVFETRVTDAGLAQLGGLKKLREVIAVRSAVTDAGAKALAAAVPGCVVKLR
ncbi:MAG: leucine-rich repeat domain-containing protein [Gemmataceae bacterium]